MRKIAAKIEYSPESIYTQSPSPSRSHLLVQFHVNFLTSFRPKNMSHLIRPSVSIEALGFLTFRSTGLVGAARPVERVVGIDFFRVSSVFRNCVGSITIVPETFWIQSQTMAGCL